MSSQLADVFNITASIMTSSVFLLSMKILFSVVALFFVVSIIVLLKRTTWLRFRFLEDFTEVTTNMPFGVKKTFKEWERLVKRLEKGKESEYRMAIVEVDALLRETLEKMGYKGQTIKDLLDQVDSKTLPNIEKIREAHNFRNTIVHDPSYELSLEETKKVIGVYEQTFRDLQMF